MNVAYAWRTAGRWYCLIVGIPCALAASMIGTVKCTTFLHLLDLYTLLYYHYNNNQGDLLMLLTDCNILNL